MDPPPQVKRKHFLKGRRRHAGHRCSHRSLCVCGSLSALPTQSALCPARALTAESAHEETRAQLWPQLAATADLGSENRGPGPASWEGRVIHVSSGDTRVPSMSLRGSYRTRREAALGTASGDLTRQLLRTVSIQHRHRKRLQLCHHARPADTLNSPR